MSTKIYEAYRVPVSRLNDALDFWREAYLDYAMSYLHTCVKQKMEQDEFKDKSEYVAMCEVVREISKVNDEAGEGFNYIECSVNVWVYKGKAYMIPYKSGGWGVSGLGNIELPDFFEDYCYFNNTDKPGHITEREWASRKRTWNKVCLDDWYKAPRRLNFEIVDPFSINGRVAIQIAYLDRYLTKTT